MAALSQTINSINVEQASESDMIKQKSQGWGWGEGHKSIFVVNASKKGAELLDKNITPLDSCRLFVFLLLFSVCLAFMCDCQPEEQLLFLDHRVKAVRKPETSETETCQSNKPCQGTVKPHNAPHALVSPLKAPASVSIKER